MSLTRIQSNSYQMRRHFGGHFLGEILFDNYSTVHEVHTSQIKHYVQSDSVCAKQMKPVGEIKAS